MKILNNTLYVLTPDVYLALDGENVVLQKGKTELHRIPLHNLEGIVAFGYTGASPALMGGCASRGIALTFLTMHGRFLARVTGEQQGNILLRKEQYRTSDDAMQSAIIAKEMITGKLFNSRWVIQRAIRNYALRLDTERLQFVCSSLAESIHALQAAQTLDEIRGIEGEAATQYFSVFDDLILQQKEDFFFRKRNRRPPLDNLNAMLSFVYTLLAHDVASALETVGLDPYCGFLHRDRPGRTSLALDLMEELRSVMADRFVLTLINTRQINGQGFLQKEDGAIIMDDDTRKILLAAWQKKKQEEIKHPLLGQKIQWGLVPYVQATLLARFLRNDIDAYPPFLWK